MEVVYVPIFVVGKGEDSVMSSLGLLSAMVDTLATERKPGTDVTLSLMKTLSYLKPITGVSCLNGMFETLKDLLFELHLVGGKSKKLASLEFTDAKHDILSKEIQDSFEQALVFQGLLKKEHSKTVKMFEECAHEIYKKESEITMSELKMKQYRRIPLDERTRKTDDKFHFHYTRVRENMQQAIPALEAKRKRLIDRELIIRDQLKTYSIQLAIMVEKQLRGVIETCKDQLLKIVQGSVISSEMVQVIESMTPGAMAHQLYLEASDVYSYPMQPQKLQFCPDCRTYIVKGVENEIMYHYVNEVGRNVNNNAAIDNNWLANIYMKAEVKYKAATQRDLKLSKGDEVKSKLISTDNTWAFGWKKAMFGRKSWGFFPTEVVKRIDEGSLKRPLVD